MHLGLLGIDVEFPLWLLLLLAVVAAYYNYMTWHFNTFKKMGVKGPKPVPVLGNLYPILKAGLRDTEIEYPKKHGKTYGIFFGRTPSLTVTDPEVVKQVLVKEFPHFVNRQTQSLQNPEGILAKGLLELQDDHWRHVRASLTPTFSAQKLKLFQKQIVKCADQLINHMQEVCDLDQEFEAKEFASAFTMDVIAYTTYGIELDCQQDPDNTFVKMNKEILKVSLNSPKLMLMFFFPFLGPKISKYFPFIPAATDRFFFQLSHDVVSRRKQEHDAKKASDFVQLMAEALIEKPTKRDAGRDDVHEDGGGGYWSSKGLTEHEIASNSMLFLFAGYETVSATMSFAMYCLATNPECQQRVIQEIDDVIGGKEPSYDAVFKLDYLQQVIDETLRIYAPAPRLERAVREEITIDGLTIPKGIQVGIPVIALHMDPDVWPEPDKFDPDRFTDEAKRARSPYSYMPFGLGPRNCIGMRLALLEMKIALVKVFQRFRLVTCDKTQIPLVIAKERVNAKDGIWLKLRVRDDVE